MDYLDNLGLLALGTRLKRLSDTIMIDGFELYSKTGIDFDPKWFPVFRLLSEKEALGIMEIAERLNISHPYVIQLVKSMEKKGVVSNVKDTSDKRKRSVALTVYGLELLDKVRPLWEDIENTIENLLRDTQNEIFTNIINLENSFKERGFMDRVLDTHKQRLINEVKIIPFTSENRADFKTLNIEWLEKYFTVEPIDDKVLSNPEKYIIDEGGEIIYASLNHEILGTCALKKKSDGVYELSKMAVTEKAQGLQLGKKLGLEIIRIAREKNAHLLYLESNRSLKTALSLYQKLGFTEAVNPDPSDYVRSNIYMELKLN